LPKRASARGRSDELKDLLAEMDAEYGRPSPEAFAWARRGLAQEGRERVRGAEEGRLEEDRHPVKS
jgi:ketosteroid isomerase-like protein